MKKINLVGTIEVTVSVRKTIQAGKDTVDFTFACDGTPCTSRTVALAHLLFDKTADFTDTTSVSVEGTVSIAATKEFNGAGNPCPIELAKVCAINHYGANEQLVCRDTDAYGVLPFDMCESYDLNKELYCAFQVGTHFLFLEG